MPIQKTKGFVLRREDVRETSLLLTFYTEDFGKLKLISKGVRSPEQKFISAYELFALDDIIFYERRKKGFFLLSECVLLNFFPKTRSSLDRLSFAVYFIELLDFITPVGEKNAEMYDLLLNSLELLSSNASPKRVARIFEIKMLSILGLMPRLSSCANCDKKVSGPRIRFSFSSGGLLCESCLRFDKKARPILLGTINFISHIEQLPFDKLKHIKVSMRVGGEVEKLLRDFIDYHLDVKLKSVSFISKINR